LIRLKAAGAKPCPASFQDVLKRVGEEVFGPVGGGEKLTIL
jgi:hypothetical protein